MASDIPNKVGIILTGWFLDCPDLVSVMPDYVSNAVRESSVVGMIEHVEQLRPPLDQAYKFLWADRKVRNWRRDSEVWQSLHYETYKTASVHLFPSGRTASRIAALTLAERLRDEDRVVIFHPPVVSDERQTTEDMPMHASAKQTWQWLNDYGGYGSLNLTLCPGDLEGGYKWVAALYNDSFRDKNLTLYNWNMKAGGPMILQIPASLNYYHRDSDFLSHYLRQSEPDPNDEREKNLSLHFRDSKTRLDEIVSSSKNEKLKVVLAAWLEWRLIVEQGQKEEKDEEELKKQYEAEDHERLKQATSKHRRVEE